MTTHDLIRDLGSWIRSGRPNVEPLVAPSGDPRTCPSYPDAQSGTAFAVRKADGVLRFIDEHTPADVERPTTPVRSYGPCLKIRCVYWSGHCSLGAQIAEISIRRALTDTTSASKACPIRGTCRWYAENGATACAGCLLADYHPSQGQHRQLEATRSHAPQIS